VLVIVVGVLVWGDNDLQALKDVGRHLQKSPIFVGLVSKKRPDNLGSLQIAANP